MVHTRADVRAPDASGRFALDYACGNGHNAVVKVLLAAGAQATNKAEDGTTALHHDAVGGSVAMVRMRLDAGVSPHEVDNIGLTALAYAVVKGHRGVVDVLRAAGASPIAHTPHIRAFLHVLDVWKPRHDKQQITTSADNEAKFQSRNGDVMKGLSNIHRKCTPEALAKGLHWAAKRGYADLVALLLVGSVDVNSWQRDDSARELNTDAQAPLHLEDEEEENEDEEGKGYTTALQEACLHGHLDSMKLLLDARARLKDMENGDTILSAAIKRGNVDVVKLLLTVVADVDDKSESGYTALHDAAELGRVDMVRTLLDAQARADACVDDEYGGETALNLACVNGNMDVLELLLDHPSVRALDSWQECCDRALYVSAECGDVDAAKVLLAKGANLHVMDQFADKPALTHAVANGHTAVVDVLIAAIKKWMWNAKVKYYMTSVVLERQRWCKCDLIMVFGIILILVLVLVRVPATAPALGLVLVPVPVPVRGTREGDC